VLIVTDEIRDLIVSRASTEDIARAARRGGMATLRDDALRKAAQGITTLSEVIRVTRKNVSIQDLDQDVLLVRNVRRCRTSLRFPRGVKRSRRSPDSVTGSRTSWSRSWMETFFRVTRITSESVVMPWAAFRSASSRSVAMPPRLAARAMSSVEARETMRSRISSVTISTSKIPRRPGNRLPAGHASGADHEISPDRGDAPARRALPRGARSGAAFLAHAADEPLRHHPQHRRGEEEGLDLHVEETGQGSGGVVRMERREHEVSGERGAHRDLGGLAVTDLPDHDHVRILAEKGAQSASEREAHVGIHLSLAESTAGGIPRGPRASRCSARPC